MPIPAIARPICTATYWNKIKKINFTCGSVIQDGACRQRGHAADVSEFVPGRSKASYGLDGRNPSRKPGGGISR